MEGVYLMGKLVMEVLQLVRVGVLFVLAASVTWGFGEGTPYFTVSVNGPKCCNFLYFSFLFSLFLFCWYAARTSGPLILYNKVD